MKKILRILANSIVDLLIERRLVEQLSSAVAGVVQTRVFEITTLEIARMELKPGDTIILKCKTALSDQAFARLRESAQEQFPDQKHKVIVLEDGLDIAVLGG